MTPLVLLGGGGHCRSCIDVIEAEGKFRIEGIVEAAGASHGELFGYPVLGSDDDLPRILATVPNALISVGQVKSSAARARLFDLVRGQGAALPVVISPKAHVSRRAALGDGSIVMHSAVVNAGAVIGVNTIVNTMALVEHDAVVGDHCHVSTGARVNGGAVIANGCFIGSGAVIFQEVRVGANAVIGGGCVVTRDVPAGTIVRAQPREAK